MQNTIEHHARVLAETIDTYARDNALGTLKLTSVSGPGGTSVTLRSGNRQAIGQAVTPELEKAVEEAAAEEASTAPQEPASKPRKRGKGKAAVETAPVDSETHTLDTEAA